MSKNFNLLSLHTPEDLHPRSWVCIRGYTTKKIIRELKNEVLLKKNCSQEKLNRNIANALHCSVSTIRQILEIKKKFYPIPVILELLKFINNKQKFLQEFKKIDSLKINSASANPVKAIYVVSKNLAKILGAFMADGSLSAQHIIASSESKHLKIIKEKLKKTGIHYSQGNAPSRRQYYISIQLNKNNLQNFNRLLRQSKFLNQSHYNIELTDEYKDNVKAFIHWIQKEFKINPTSIRKRGNAWRVTFSNKILARYLMRFFDVMPGPKTFDAFEPVSIKKSSFKIRQAFAQGVLMFDGCVSIEKKVLFSSKSEYLVNSIKEIWDKDGVNYGYSFNHKRNEFNVFSTVRNREERLQKYFEKDTQKWKLLKWITGDLSQQPRIKHSSSAASVSTFLKMIQKNGSCDTAFLSNHFQCYPHVARTYLKILKCQKRIRLSSRPKKISNFVSLNTRVFLKYATHKLIFNSIKKQFKTDKNFADFLNIKKATLSAWRLRKNRIPLYILQKTCTSLKKDFQKVCCNIQQTDREIAEII